ncbi:CBM96 family carbohydrate-binding protein [Algoriphagus resistens]|uniref:CBM96 family carbohydrate-binding protein n=1 Tax=Algoriphagus resistens TaxID=1750590 RepID=UPI000716AEED|nr:DNRLRE domain-containing protein [Algoriphagus resistens]
MRSIKSGKLATVLIPVIMGMGMLYSCTIQENFEYEGSNSTGELGISALSYFKNEDSFSMLSTAIELAGLDELYERSDISTYIAPTNAAFEAYLESNSYASLEDIPVPILRNVLKYHIVTDKVLFTDPELFESNFPIAYDTESGQTLFLSHNPSFVGLVNQGTSKQWEISTSNLEPTNGVIHIVNSIVYFSAASVNLDELDPSVKTDTIFPLADTYINGGADAGKNFGALNLLKVKSVTGDGDFDRKAYLMFDLNELEQEGVITDLRFQIGISFTHGKNLAMNLYQIADTTWTEMGLNWNNATPADSPPVASIITAKVDAFNFDLTDFYGKQEKPGKISLMMDGQEKGDETNDLGSKEHSSIPAPMIIATIATGESSLDLLTNSGFSVERGNSFALSKEIVEVSGASANDIIYTVEETPSFGWLISGATTLKAGDRFTQNDIDVLNLIYINNGEGSEDRLVLSARDRAGAKLDPFEITIAIL